MGSRRIIGWRGLGIGVSGVFCASAMAGAVVSPVGWGEGVGGLVPSGETPRAVDEGEQTPRQILENLQDVLLQAMRRGEELGFSGRRNLIEPTAVKAHSVSSLARLVLHAHWDALSEADQGRFVDALGRLTVAAYAARFDSYNGQRFEILHEREMRDGVMLVRTRLVKSDGKGVALDYFLRRFEAGWRIVNIVADGVSEVAVKRAEYDAIIAKDGFDGLLEVIERQIADFEAGRDDRGG